MIPKVIHYCWFGNNKKSRLIINCINSWKKYLPDYEIIEWNESNFDINQCKYAKQAYDLKKWAYVSDYVRMKVLSKYGGIYFDTDVQVLKPFPERLLDKAFCGIEEFSKLVSPGLVYGCESGDVIVCEMIKQYESEQFIFDNISDVITINKRITRILVNYGYVHDDIFQSLEVIDIYPSEYFCAYDGKTRKKKITGNSLATHLYAASWLPWHKKIRLWLGTQARHIGLINK